MKLINQSFEILPEREDLIKQIGERSRICYQSENQEDETKFVQGIIRKGHNSCLEMATISLDISGMFPGQKRYFDITSGQCYTATGSVRAWREYLTINQHYCGRIIGFLKKHVKLLFDDINESRHLDIVQNYVGFSQKIAAHYERVAVKFITNRAVSHELVRHRPNGILQESQRYCRYGDDVTFIKPTAFFKEDTYEWNVWEQACKTSEVDYLELLETSSPQAARTVLPNSCKTEVILYAPLYQWEHIFAMRAVNSGAEPSMREIMTQVHEEFKSRYPGMFNNPQPSVGR